MADGRKKLSGFQYRKRKLEKEEKVKKCTSSICKFLQKVQPGPSTSSDMNPVFEKTVEDTMMGVTETSTDTPMEEISATSASEATLTPTAAASVTTTAFSDHISNNSSSVMNANIIDSLTDPALWPQSISDNVKLSLLEIGPVQIKIFTFPLDDSNRSFSTTYFLKKLGNNETVIRDWLVYSKSSDSVFCFYCKLFSSAINAFNDKIGYKDWRHLSRNIERHEKSVAHFQSVRQYVDLKQNIMKGRTVDSINQAQMDREKKGGWQLLKELYTLFSFWLDKIWLLEGIQKRYFKMIMETF